MKNVNNTLYIPLFGKSLVSKKGIILADKWAEQIWEVEQFPLKGKSKSKWLAYYMGMRSSVFDKWTSDTISSMDNPIVLHLGCGLDSRAFRISPETVDWYDIDFDDVISERRRYYSETDSYHMLAADISDASFVNLLPESNNAIVVMEGVSMYLTNDSLSTTLAALVGRFEHVSLLVDCYSPFAAKMSAVRNPINDVGVTKVYGISNPDLLTKNTGLTFIKEHDITPKHLIDELSGLERFIFRLLYAGHFAKSLYKLYEYKS